MIVDEAMVKPDPRGGASRIVAATAVAGIAGYAVTFLVFRFVGAATYALFAAFWAGLYLLVGGLSGVQQEIARATRLVDFGVRARASRARNFAIGVAGSLLVLIIASSPLWAELAFARNGESFAIPLAVGASSYVLVAALTGSLYGISQWKGIFLLIVVDAVLRLTLVVLALVLTNDVVWVAWATALPFPLALVILWRVIRPGLVGRTDLDVGYRTLAWNVARTVLASVSAAVLVSGFPLVLSIASGGVAPALVGELVFAITITRAPLIVTVSALQSFFLVRFRDATGSGRNALALLLSALIGGAIVLAGIAFVVGPPILSWLSGRPTVIGGEFLAILVMSSGLIAALTVTGSALLARSRHFGYSLGWVLSAVVTIAVVSLPFAFIARVELAVLAGPALGLGLHLIWLGLSRRSAPTEA